MNNKLKEEAMQFQGFNPYLGLGEVFENPIFSPRRHDVETYRSQQRKAKKRKKSKKNINKKRAYGKDMESHSTRN